MRELITKVSDYLNERRNDPDRQEDRLAVVIIGVAAVIVIVLLLLLLWGHIVRVRREKEEESAMGTATYEEKAMEYMSQNNEALRQEYASQVDYLNGRIEELLAAMTQVEQSLAETIEQYQEADASLLEEISSLHQEVNTIMYNLKRTQTDLYDLADIVQVMNEETIPQIQEQIVQIEASLQQVYTDVADLYTKVEALEQEDIKLWESIGNVESIIGKLSANTLRYRYDEGTNTLYLEPYEK